MAPTRSEYHTTVFERREFDFSGRKSIAPSAKANQTTMISQRAQHRRQRPTIALGEPSIQPSMVLNNQECFSRRRSNEHIIGVSVRATKPDTSTAGGRQCKLDEQPAGTPGHQRQRCEYRVKVSVIATSRSRFRALDRGFLRGMPCSTCRKMFSSITMASSTTRPIASTIASSVNVLIVNRTRTSTNAPIRDTGIADRDERSAQVRRKENDQHDQRDGLDDRFEHRTDRFSMNTDVSYETISPCPAAATRS
jgi:hypothetical protein